jgi:hypothetical protein
MPSLQHQYLFSRLLVVCALSASLANAQLVERGAKISGTGASQSDSARQGTSVALSTEGTTLIEGGPYDGHGRGAAWVFRWSGKAWIEEGEKLRATDAIGANVFQGRSVALSADGNTALIGGDGDNEGAGAAWVFTRVDGHLDRAGQADRQQRDRQSTPRFGGGALLRWKHSHPRRDIR